MIITVFKTQKKLLQHELLTLSVQTTCNSRILTFNKLLLLKSKETKCRFHFLAGPATSIIKILSDTASS